MPKNKTLLITVVLCVCVLAIGQTKTSHQTTPGELSHGRYQILFGPFARADVYLLDTETGKVWHPVTFTDVAEQPEVWMPQEKIDNNQQWQVWSVEHPSTKEHPTNQK